MIQNIRAELLEDGVLSDLRFEAQDYSAEGVRSFEAFIENEEQLTDGMWYTPMEYYKTLKCGTETEQTNG